MKPSEVRKRILDDHTALRGQLASLESVAGEVLEGDRRLLGALRLEAETLLEHLQQHMHWEDLYLAPALRTADSWGQERARKLDDDHREQRELLDHMLRSLRDGTRPAPVLARSLRDFVQLLLDDMEWEEQTLVSDRILRDDVIAIGAESG